MTETTIGRAPVQIVEINQPICGHVWGVGKCRAGGGNLDDIFTTDFSGGVGVWAGTTATLTQAGDRAIFAATGSGSYLSCSAQSPGSDGDSFRYVIARGKLNATASEWGCAFQSDSMGSLSTAIDAENKTALSALAAGAEFMAVWDMSDSGDYATDWVGQEIEILRLDFDAGSGCDIDLYSVELAAENPLDKNDTKCFNTRATCQDVNNFRFRPQSHLIADLTLVASDTIASGDLDRTEDLFAAITLDVPLVPSGVVWEQGDDTDGAYFGFDGTDIVFRAGDGADPGGTGKAEVREAFAPYVGSRWTFLLGIDVSARSVTLWAWDDVARTITEIGTDAATTGFTSWAGTDGGAIGEEGGSGIVDGVDATDFNGTVVSANFYDATAAPDMSVSLRILLRFSHGTVEDRGLAPYVIPALKSVSTVPTRINLSTADRNATGLGNRASVTAQFDDPNHDDLFVDPYIDGRTYDAKSRGTFWTKWAIRNPYRYNMTMKVYEGYAGEALSAMRQRTYFITDFMGPNQNGVNIKGIDVLSKIEERKAQAPEASPGTLYADITDSATTFEVSGAVLTDYEAAGTLRIDDELMTYSSVANSANGIEFTITERGSDGTTAAAHSAAETVQRCVRYTNATVNTIVEDLLVNWGGVPASLLDIYGTFASEVTSYLSGVTLSTVINEPVSVATLLSELQEQGSFYIWWDERDAIIKLRAVRGISEQPPILNADEDLIEFSVKDLPRSRISQVWFHHGLRTPVSSLKEQINYRYVQIQADLASEGDDQHGEKSVRKIFSRWVNSTAIALSTASKIVTRYADVPREAIFVLDAKDRNLWVGDAIQITHPREIDEFGAPLTRTWTIISAEEHEHGHAVRYTAQDTTLYGTIVKIQAASAADYTPGADPTLAFIGDENGKLSDGTDCARIA